TPLSVEQAAASDVYSLGVVLYELLTGRLPYGSARGSTRLECVDAMLARQQLPHVPLRERNPRVPKRMADMIERCLSSELTARPSAAQLAAALTPKRRRLLFAGLAALLVVVLAQASVSAWAIVPPSESGSRERAHKKFDQGRELLAQDKTDEARQNLLQADQALSDAMRTRERSG